jgi:alcohol dehydrogenase class IV
VIKEIEGILGTKHVKTFSKIAQHAPIQAIREAAEEAKKSGVDVFISVGGGSPIDSVKGTMPFEEANCSDCTFFTKGFGRGVSSSHCHSYNSICRRHVS